MGKAKKRTAARKKQEKIKLTKQQQQNVGQMISLENRISVCRDYIGLWSRFFRFFAEELHDRQIKPEEEKAFFQTVTLLARKHFLFTELMDDAFEEGDQVIEVLAQTVSLTHIKNMDEGTLSKLELDWHTLFLNMNQTLGRLVRRMPGGLKLNEALKQATEKAREAKAGGGAKPTGFLARFRKSKS